jgi:hypothetical protein
VREGISEKGWVQCYCVDVSQMHERNDLCFLTTLLSYFRYAVSQRCSIQYGFMEYTIFHIRSGADVAAHYTFS